MDDRKRKHIYLTAGLEPLAGLAHTAYKNLDRTHFCTTIIILPSYASMHSIRFAIILTVLALCGTLLGYLLLGTFGALIFLAIIAFLYVFLYFEAKHIVIGSTHATLVTKEKYPDLCATVHDICTHLKISDPTIYLSPSPQANALLVGHSTHKTNLVITRGLLEMKNQEEAIALMTLALCYSNLDLFFHTYVIAFASLFTKVAQYGQFSILKPVKRREKGNSFGALLFFILAPFAAFCIKIVTDKSRHYRADLLAATAIRKPEVLARSLLTVSEGIEDDIPLINPNPATVALYIVHPFSHKTLSSFFDTHPTLETRITKLTNMHI